MSESTERARAFLAASKLLIEKGKPKTATERELRETCLTLFGIIEDLLKEREK